MESIIGTVAVIAGLGLTGAVLLLVVSKALGVKEDGRLAYLVGILPGVNCGSCGFAGCEAYAKALLEDGAAANACTVGGDVVSAEVAAFLGVEAQSPVARKAIVSCQGSSQHINPHFEFEGVQSCRVFSTLFFSSRSCPFGCLGFGDCVALCEFGAISITEDIASVDQALCIGCGKCISVCPRGVISMHEQRGSDLISIVTCKNTMNPKQTREVCSIGCIGCQKCARACPVQAITVTDNLASINSRLCIGCGTCVDICPTGAISPLQFR
ncbi:MAG: RnfABCDGE type electron transport complex subunit B [Raoultibacter sp.]